MKNLSKAGYIKIFTGFFLMTVLPFIILAFYCHPGLVEDYFFWDRVNKVGFIKAFTSLYNYWSGRYFSHSASLISPLLFQSYIGYKIYIFVIFILFFFILYLFISEVTKKNITSLEKLFISSAVFFLFLYSMPAVAQGFYWFISISVYINSIILILLFMIFFIRLKEKDEFKSRLLYTLICSLLVFAIAGSNEIATAITMFLISALWFANFKEKGKLNWSLVIISISVAAGFIIDVLSPGTLQRHTKFAGNHNFHDSIISSFTYICESIFNWIFLTPLIPVSIILIPVLLSYLKSDSKPVLFFFNPYVSILASFFLLYSNVFIFIWSMGKIPFPRSMNLIYFTFLILWLYNLLVMLKHFQKKSRFKLETIPGYVYGICFALILIFMLKDNNIKTAYADIFTGAASQYDKEMYGRYDFIQKSSADSVAIEKIKNIPETIYLFDITKDPDNINNKWFSSHFKKKSIVLQKNE